MVDTPESDHFAAHHKNQSGANIEWEKSAVASEDNSEVVIFINELVSKSCQNPFKK
jgi:hypothetical protein